VKYLTVLRHAKSAWAESGLADVERPLNKRGRMAAKRVGQELQLKWQSYDIVLASPAVRVRETLDRLRLGIGNLPPPSFRPELYLADLPTLVRSLHLLDDAINRVLLVGHNPGLQQLIVQLAAPTDRLRGDVQTKFPTGAAALLEMDVARWRDVASASAEILSLIFPRELKP
jgi:phosphohistidine phosphatase